MYLQRINQSRSFRRIQSNERPYCIKKRSIIDTAMFFLDMILWMIKYIRVSETITSCKSMSCLLSQSIIGNGGRSWWWAGVHAMRFQRYLGYSRVSVTIVTIVREVQSLRVSSHRHNRLWCPIVRDVQPVEGIAVKLMEACTSLTWFHPERNSQPSVMQLSEHNLYKNDFRSAVYRVYDAQSTFMIADAHMQVDNFR